MAIYDTESLVKNLMMGVNNKHVGENPHAEGDLIDTLGNDLIDTMSNDVIDTLETEEVFTDVYDEDAEIPTYEVETSISEQESIQDVTTEVESDNEDYSFEAFEEGEEDNTDFEELPWGMEDEDSETDEDDDSFEELTWGVEDDKSELDSETEELPWGGLSELEELPYKGEEPLNNIEDEVVTESSDEPKNSEDVETEVFQLPKGVKFRPGMLLIDFLRENPEFRKEEDVLKLFNKSAISDLVVKGVVFIKKGKLWI